MLQPKGTLWVAMNPLTMAKAETLGNFRQKICTLYARASCASIFVVNTVEVQVWNDSE